jgi:hypothetical protein
LYLSRYFSPYYLLGAFLFFFTNSSGQTADTISNWDNITPNWVVIDAASQRIGNPQPDAVNSSAHCLVITTLVNTNELLYCNLPEAVNFDSIPHYAISVLAPPGGGDVMLKFENSDVSAWQELILTPEPGHWTRLEFNFAGLSYNNFTRVVIFPDFNGYGVGQHWYLDDVVEVIPEPISLQTNLPIIVINTSGQTINDEPKIMARMGIIDNGEGQMNQLTDTFNDYDGWIGIETRGQSTQMFPKKSFAVETREESGENLDVSILGMPADNDWILYAPYTDKSMLRNLISFEMTRRTGHYCTRMRFVEVVINNDYKGVYIWEEKIKKGENRVDIGTLKPDEISGDDLTGGYILNVDKIDWDFDYGDDGWKSDPSPAYPNAMDITFQFYYPAADEIVAQQRTYIKNWVTLAENKLCGTYFKDPLIGYMRYLDVPSFIDYMLICEISKEVDKYRYSTYFYKEKDSDGGKLHAGPAWDFNLGYGNVDYWAPGVDFTGWLYPMVEPVDWSIMFWWKRLMEDPYFCNLAKTRYHQLRETKLSDNYLQSVIDSAQLVIDQAKDRNFDRWPILGQYVWPNYDWQNNSYQDEVNYVRSFLFNRLHWMDDYFPGEIIHPWASISASENLITLELNKDYFCNPILKVSDFTLNDAPNGVYIQSVAYKAANRCELTLSSDLINAHDLSVTVTEKVINSYNDIVSNKIGYTGIESTERETVRITVNSGLITLHNDHSAFYPETAEIFSLTGQRIQQYTLNEENEITLSQPLKAGIYILVLRSGETFHSQKIVVM